MPFAAKHECGATGCKALTDRRFCSDHGPAVEPTHRWDTDRRPVKRIRGRKLQKIRADVFREEPWCRMCAGQGKRALATIVDHIVNLGDRGRDVPENRQPLCKNCSDAKTMEESKRGLRAYHRTTGGSRNR